MGRFIVRRLLQAIPLLLIISIFIFVLLQSSGDPLAAMGGKRLTRPEDRARLKRLMGLDQPIYMQYIYWLVGNTWVQIDVDGDGIPDTNGTRLGVLRGDFGDSLVNRGQPALDIIMDRLPNTLLLMIPAEIIILFFSLLIGIYSALRQYSLTDQVITAGSFIGYSMPIFFVALASMYIFAVNFRKWGLPYLPTVGMFDPKIGKSFSQVAVHMVLPIISMSLVSISGYSRFVRSQMLEVISQDYIRTAYAKGLSERLVLMGHALKNAAIPFVTLVGIDIPFLLGGAVVTETIFGWPGMGRLFIDHLNRFDTPVVMGILMLISLAVVIFQLITDIVYSWLDPRIRYS
ncbi:MAG: ABC transporter permease [Anaerolineales bacterium]|jgi:peptide/nickel transport system permease protein